jgi:hypothetical protein
MREARIRMAAYTKSPLLTMASFLSFSNERYSLFSFARC